GNLSDPATLTVLLTQTPPDASVAPALLSSSATGPNPFAPYTNLHTPQIRLFAERAALVTFYDGDTQIGQAFSTGVSQITTPALADGVHPITAVIQDQAGNVSARTPALMLTVDTSPPAVPTLALDASQQDPVRANYTTFDKVILNGQVTPEVGELPDTLQLV